MGKPGSGRIVALAGGVGAARFLRGLLRAVDPASVTVIVNTADDIERHGLWVSPDVDSVIYGLAGLADERRGWGRGGESWRCLEALTALGEDTWFQLGDLDLATHVWRSERCRRGDPLSQICAEQAARLGVGATILPMTDAVVTTRVSCAGLGELHLQEYLVRERCEPPITAIRVEGLESAAPAPGVLEAIAEAEAVVICPSNPVISIGPVLGVAGVRDALSSAPACAAVTPIIGGAAVRGPAAEMLAHRGVEVSAVGVASLYAGLCASFVLDRRDRDLAPGVAALGMRPVVADTVMRDLRASARLAGVVCGALGLSGRGVAA